MGSYSLPQRGVGVAGLRAPDGASSPELPYENRGHYHGHGHDAPQGKPGYWCWSWRWGGWLNQGLEESDDVIDLLGCEGYATYCGPPRGSIELNGVVKSNSILQGKYGIIVEEGASVLDSE